MKKYILLLAAFAFVFGMAMVTLPSTAQAGKIEVPKGEVAVGAAKKFTFYGYVKFRMNFEDKIASVAGGFYDPRRIPHDNTTKGENEHMNFNARQSRFGFKMVGDSFAGWTTGGRMEFDMYWGGGNHHSEAPRMRIGELYLTKGNTKITIGKGWAMFGTRHAPMVENFGSIVGDGFRRALRVDIAQKFPSGDNTFGAELMVMTYDDDANGFNTENFGFPYTSVELSLISKALGYAGGKPLGIWLQGLYGNMAEPDDIYEDGVKVRSGDDYDVYGVELDWYVPIIASKDRGKKAGNLALSGKAWWGQALGNANLLCNMYTVVVKPDGDLDEVEGYGGWVGLSYWITDHVWVDVYGGYEGIDTSEYYPGDMVEDNYEITANIWWKPARSILFGIEYAYVDNEFYKEDAYGEDSAELNSIAFVVYYFF